MQLHLALKLLRTAKITIFRPPTHIPYSNTKGASLNVEGLLLYQHPLPPLPPNYLTIPKIPLKQKRLPKHRPPNFPSRYGNSCFSRG